MRIVRSVRAMQRLALAWKRQGKAVGFVPTMGYLHAGHISLLARARRLVGVKGIIGASIYVNPTQFAPTEDLSRYPRDLPRDTKLCRDAGADFLFVPSDFEMYPPASGGFSTFVVEEKLSQGMEGVSRPTHFRGVTTVVAKLFNIVQPTVAVFGAKDFQQAAVIQKMVKDLNFPLKIVVAPTLRESDGLAMSSRNKYLSVEERREAVALSEALRFAKELVRKKPRDTGALKKEIRERIEKHPGFRVDYVEIFDPKTLQPSPVAKPGMQMALAAFLGKTRLIDNGPL
jgi:pantoate--beta-alanine ligase